MKQIVNLVLRKLKLVTWLNLLVTSVAFATSAESIPSSEIPSTNPSFTSRFGVELMGAFSPYTSYLSRSGPSYPTMNIMGGFRAKYSMLPHLGIYLGLDFLNRGYELPSGNTSSPLFEDLVFGIEFKQPGALGFRGISLVKLGGFTSFSSGQLTDYGQVVAANPKVTGGVMFEASALFHIWELLHVGPLVGVKYTIRSPYAAEASYPVVDRVISVLDLYLGLSATYSFDF